MQMAEYADREHFIPLRRGELIELLCGDKDLPADERESFRQFCRLVLAICHFEHNQVLEQLKSAYAPFDPDTDVKSVMKCLQDERQRKLNDLFSDFGHLMDQADFKHLGREEMEPAIGAHSQWGLRMDVDFRVFERLAIFARGDAVEKRECRLPGSFWRKETVSVPVHRRVVMILKLRKHRRLPANVNTEKVYLQVFKDIPKQDLCMLLPGARVRMSKLDRGKIGLPMLSGLAIAAWNICRNIADDLMKIFIAWQEPAALWAIASGAVGYGVRSYYGYYQTRQSYTLNLTRVLYFQNLDTNSGVLFRLLDEAEEQQCRETILAYYFLWRYAGERGWLARDLDDYIELDLDRRCNLKVDFDVSEALVRLEKMRIVEKVGDRYRARPIAQALQILDFAWDNYFKYNNPEPEESPIPDQEPVSRERL